MAKVETLLTNWRLHLPPGKRDPVDKSCLHDEMMFQAHFITTAWVPQLCHLLFQTHDLLRFLG